MDSAAPHPGRIAAACISAGSNLGDRDEHLRAAVAALRAEPGIEVLAVSALYETDPVGPPPQGPYLNLAIRVATRLAPRALLDRLLALEAARGRKRGGERWGPRSLDLDLLLYADACIDEPGLQVPHPRLHARAFVLEPLQEVAPEWLHPRLGVRIDELARRARDPAGVRRRPPPGPPDPRNEQR